MEEERLTWDRKEVRFFFYVGSKEFFVTAIPKAGAHFLLFLTSNVGSREVSIVCVLCVCVCVFLASLLGIRF
jgi:hypothetical protein